MRALASTVRLRILRMCLHEARTNQEIAEKLGMHRATVLHHVRTLVDTGFLAAEGERTGARGAKEIPYRSTRKSWNTRSPRTGQVLVDTFIEDLQGVEPEDLIAARMGMKVSDADRKEFMQRLAALLDDYANRDADPDGKAWSVFFAIHPDTTP